jgi:membrane associated rhomboid family serine protease
MDVSRASRVTVAIAVATVLAWLAQITVAGPHVVLQGGFVPVRATEPFPFENVPFSLTPLSATLLHGGLLHLGINLLMLVVCGRAVEQAVGGGKLLLLYAIGAYGAAAAQYFVDPVSSTPMIGASGAISAVVGTYAMLFGRQKVRSIGPIPGLVVRGLWLAAAWTVIQWGISFASAAGPFSVATAAHVGGFVTGLVMTVPLIEWRYRYG